MGTRFLFAFIGVLFAIVEAKSKYLLVELERVPLLSFHSSVGHGGEPFRRPPPFAPQRPKRPAFPTRAKPQLGEPADKMGGQDSRLAIDGENGEFLSYEVKLDKNVQNTTGGRIGSKGSKTIYRDIRRLR